MPYHQDMAFLQESSPFGFTHGDDITLKLDAELVSASNFLNRRLNRNEDSKMGSTLQD